MWLVDEYQVKDRELLLEIIHQNPLATVVTLDSWSQPPALFANHLPLLLDPEEGSSEYGDLIGHLSIQNPQCGHFAQATPVLVIFQGPHAYISPSTGRHSLTVPTWNYISVHVFGRPVLVEDPAEKIQIIEKQSRGMEKDADAPWPFERLPQHFVEKLAAQIMGFRIRIERIESQFKLNQDRRPTERESIVAHLSEAPHEGARDIAAWMKKLCLPADPGTKEP